MITSADEVIKLSNVSYERIFQEILTKINDSILSAAKEGKYSVDIEVPPEYGSRIRKTFEGMVSQNNCEYKIIYAGSSVGKTSYIIKWIKL